MKKISGLDIAIFICTAFAVFIYFYGVRAWKDTLNQPQAIVDHGSHIFFLSFESSFYAGTLVGVIIADRFWVKVFTRGLNSLVAVILYEELRYGDRQWETWTYWLPVVVLINYFLLYATIDKIKKMVKNGR